MDAPTLTIPKLNFSTKKNRKNRKVKKKLSRSDSFSLEKEVSISQLIDQYKILSSSIEDIKVGLGAITTSSSTAELLDDCIKEFKIMKTHLYGIESSPRFLSRVDAVVANSQVLINRFDIMKKEILTDIEDNDSTINGRIDRVIDIQKSILETQYRIDGVLNLLLNKISKVEEIIIEIDETNISEDKDDNVPKENISDTQ